MAILWCLSEAKGFEWNCFVGAPKWKASISLCFKKLIINAVSGFSLKR